MKRFGYRWRALTLGAMLVGLAVVRPAGVHAATDTVSTCDESTLRSVISSAAANDMVNFGCSGTITLTSGGGGAITLSKNLTIDGTGQTVTISGGGAVQVFTVPGGVTATLNGLTVANGFISNGNGNGDGGGIYNNGTLAVTNSTLSGNKARIGAGIANYGTLRVTNSTLSGNSANAFGGGILNGGTLSVTNSTFSGNVCTGCGGSAIGNNGTLAVTNSTFSGNSGGVAIINFNNTATVGASILANNTAGNCAGAITDNGYNLESGTDCGFTGTGSLQNTDPKLSALANNGGPTQTMALNVGSPAIDVIPSASCPSTDQRGSPRPDNSQTSCDIGAYEFQDLAVTAAAVTLSNLSQTYDGTPKSAGAGISPTTCGPVTLSYSQNGTPVSAPTTAGSYSVQASLGNSNCTIGSGGTGTLIIAQAPQTITFTALPNHIYGDAPFTVSATASSGLPVSFAVGATDTCTIAGTTVTITGAGSCTVTATQAGNTNYLAATAVVQTFSIAQASQAITFGPLANHTYGDAPFTVSATASSGLPVSFAVGATDSCTIAGTTVTITGAGCMVTATQAGNTNYQAAPSVPQSFSIAQAGLTITPDNQNMTYGGTVPAFTVSPSGYIGLVHGDQPSVVSGLSCGATDSHSRPGNSTTPAGTYTITCTGGTATNYSITYKTGTLTIGQAGLIVTANGQSKTYGSTLTFAGTEFTTSGLVNGDTVTSVTLISAGAAASAGVSGSPYAIVPSAAMGSGLGNYTIIYTNGSLTVNPKALTVTASSTTVTYGDAAPTITATYSGLIGTDSLSPAPTCSTTYTQGSGVGSYPTSCSGAVSTNYSLSYVNGSVTVSQAPQTITFTAPANKVLGSAPFTVSATGGASGNPVTFTASPSTVCTASGTNGTTITLVGVGTCTVTATQAGNTNYQAASPVTQSFSVAYPPLYLVLGLISSPAGTVTTGSTVTAKVTLGNHTTATQTVTLNVTLRYTGSHGSYSLTVPLTFKLNAGQTVSQTGSFTITKLFPRGSYVLSATATDKSGDTASSSATLTVS